MKTDYIAKLLKTHPSLKVCRDDLAQTVDALKGVVMNGNKILACGNGGSAADAEHIVGELLKGFHLKRILHDSELKKFKNAYPDDGEFIARHLERAIPAISLVSGTSFITAFANDNNPDFIFAQQVYGLGNSGDSLLAISTSGNSPNILYAAKVARLKGLKVIGLTGESGGQLKQYCDITIKAPATETASIQELHLPIYHCLCAALEQELFAS